MNLKSIQINLALGQEILVGHKQEKATIVSFASSSTPRLSCSQNLPRDYHYFLLLVPLDLLLVAAGVPRIPDELLRSSAAAFERSSSSRVLFITRCVLFAEQVTERPFLAAFWTFVV